jgi:hypothetical protein
MDIRLNTYNSFDLSEHSDKLKDITDHQNNYSSRLLRRMQRSRVPYPTNMPPYPTNMPTYPTNMLPYPTNMPPYPTNIPVKISLPSY